MAIGGWLKGKADELASRVGAQLEEQTEKLTERAKAAADRVAKETEGLRTDTGALDTAAVGGWLKAKAKSATAAASASLAKEREALRQDERVWQTIDGRFPPFRFPRMPAGMLKDYGDIPNFQESLEMWVSLLQEWPEPPRDELDREEREAVYWQRETAKNVIKRRDGRTVFLPKQDIFDRWWLSEKWNFRRYYAATGIVHPSVFSDQFVQDWKLPDRHKFKKYFYRHSPGQMNLLQSINETQRNLKHFFDATVPTHRAKWENWYLFNLQQSFENENAPPERTFASPASDL